MISRYLGFVVFASLSLPLLTNPSAAQGFLSEPPFTETGPAKAIEADHLVVNDQVTALYGIDAPLRIQPCVKDGRQFACGVEALQALEALLAQGPVTCQEVRDPHLRRRMMRYARCTIGDIDIAAAMVSSGMAMAFPDQTDEYLPLEQAARAEGTGLWAADEFQPPWEWEEALQNER